MILFLLQIKKEEEKNKKEKENKRHDDVKITKDSSSFTIGLLDSGGNPIISREYEALPTVDVCYGETIIIDYRESSDSDNQEDDDDEESHQFKNTEDQLDEDRQAEMLIEQHEEKIKDDQENHPSNSSATTDHA
jgi:hypothetical protein